MKKRNKVALSCFGLLALAVYSSLSWSEASYDERLVNQTSSKTAKILEDSHGLNLIGTGARMMNEVEKLYMAFQYYQPVDLEEAASSEHIIGKIKGKTIRLVVDSCDGGVVGRFADQLRIALCISF